MPQHLTHQASRPFEDRVHIMRAILQRLLPPFLPSLSSAGFLPLSCEGIDDSDRTNSSWKPHSTRTTPSRLSTISIASPMTKTGLFCRLGAAYFSQSIHSDIIKTWTAHGGSLVSEDLCVDLLKTCDYLPPSIIRKKSFPPLCTAADPLKIVERSLSAATYVFVTRQDGTSELLRSFYVVPLDVGWIEACIEAARVLDIAEFTLPPPLPIRAHQTHRSSIREKVSMFPQYQASSPIPSVIRRNPEQNGIKKGRLTLKPVLQLDVLPPGSGHGHYVSLSTSRSTEQLRQSSDKQEVVLPSSEQSKGIDVTELESRLPEYLLDLVVDIPADFDIKNMSDAEWTDWMERLVENVNESMASTRHEMSLPYNTTSRLEPGGLQARLIYSDGGMEEGHWMPDGCVIVGSKEKTAEHGSRLGAGAEMNLMEKTTPVDRSVSIQGEQLGDFEDILPTMDSLRGHTNLGTLARLIPPPSPPERIPSSFANPSIPRQEQAKEAIGGDGSTMTYPNQAPAENRSRRDYRGSQTETTRKRSYDLRLRRQNTAQRQAMYGMPAWIGKTRTKKSGTSRRKGSK